MDVPNFGRVWAGEKKAISSQITRERENSAQVASTVAIGLHHIVAWRRRTYMCIIAMSRAVYLAVVEWGIVIWPLMG